MTIRALVWGENVHEHTQPAVARLYPQGMHATIAAALAEGPGDGPAIVAETATLQEAEHGLSAERLARTDVLLWWGHARHDDVADAVVERVVLRVWEGMGLVVLHSGHFSKVFKRLMGTPCSLRWREAGERERLWTVDRSHPIAAGLPDRIEVPATEMYGEPFLVPEPDETVFISWFEGGEVFRSGLTWRRGAGRIFYFSPGHETYPIYHQPEIRRVIRNGVRWAYNSAPAWAGIEKGVNVPVETAPEPIRRRGPSVHGRNGEVSA